MSVTAGRAHMMREKRSRNIDWRHAISKRTMLSKCDCHQHPESNAYYTYYLAFGIEHSRPITTLVHFSSLTASSHARSAAYT